MDCQKHLFSLPDDHHYLNCAYFSPLLKSVEEAGMKGIKQKREPWHTLPDHFFEQSNTLRSLFARLVNAQRPDNIAIMPSASYGLSTVAQNLPKKTSDKKIITVGEQFPSNVYPWMRYCQNSGCKMHVIEAPAEFKRRGQEWNEKILEAIDSNTLMVAIGNIHWTDGTLFDLEAIGKQARKVGAYFVIDGTQSVGALPFDVQSIQPDALICAGYKWLMGPYSIALGYFGERFADGIPIEEGWIERKDSENFAGLVNYTDEYQPGALRYDVGERSNFILVPMMIKALQQILEWQPANIQSYCRELTQELTKELPALGYNIEESGQRTHHLFGIHLPDYIKVNDLKEKLTEHNIHVSVRGSALRVSPNVFNDERDIAALREVIVNS
jgi:selenocysteine lyase/cysteine desulfurase